MMTVEEKPDITYNDIGGNKDEIQKLREVGAPTRPLEQAVDSASH